MDKKVYAVIIALLLVLAALLRWSEYDKRALWQDENEQLAALQETSFSALMHQVMRNPGAFPGDYMLTYTAGHFTKDKTLLAIPHILTTILTFYFFIRIGESILGQSRSFLVALLLLTANKWHIFHSLELRPYGALTMMAVSYFWLVQTWHRRLTKPGPPAWTWFAGITVWTWITTLFHAYGMLIITGTTAFLLGSGYTDKTLRHPKTYLAPILLGVILSLPLFLYFARIGYISEYAVFQFIPGTPALFLKTTLALLTGNKLFYVLLVFVPLSYLPGCKKKGARTFLMASLVGLPICCILWADIRAHYWFLQRQFVWTMPFWAIFIAWCLQSFTRAYAPKTISLWKR